MTQVVLQLTCCSKTTPNDVESWPSCKINCKKNKGNYRNNAITTMIFPVKGKKNNQSSVPDEDREIPTLGSSDNAETR